MVCSYKLCEFHTGDHGLCAPDNFVNILYLVMICFVFYLHLTLCVLNINCDPSRNLNQIVLIA